MNKITGLTTKAFLILLSVIVFIPHIPDGLT